MLITADEFRNEETDKAQKFTSLFSVAIMTDLRGRPEFVASGFFLRYFNSVYLLTAAHAIDDLIQNAYVAKNGIFQIPGVGIRTFGIDEDNFDLAYWKVEEDLAEKVGAIVVDESQVLRAEFEDPFFLVSGFTASKNKASKAVRVDQKIFEQYCYTFSTFPVNLDYAIYRKSPEFHLALDYHVGINSQGEKISPKHPRGMSGSPVWIAKDQFSTDKLFLGGMLVEYDKEVKAVFCTRIEPILRGINESAQLLK